MITEIELMRLRDIAFKYLPAARDAMQAKKFRMNHCNYYLEIYRTAIGLVSRNMSAVELASAYLLQALASHALYDTNDPEQQCDGVTPQELYDSTISSIARAVKVLAEVTERTITFDANVTTEIKINNVKGRRPAQIELLLSVIDELQPDRLNIPVGEKQKALDKCLKSPSVFSSESVFNKVWSELSESGQISISGKENFLPIQ
ncbi:MAG: hypothetical protein ACXWFG_13440 [Methylobacter sp.]